MGTEGAHETGFEVIVVAVFTSGLFYDGGDVAVMNMADIWEEVVLDLEIESAYVPVEEAVMPCEVGCGAQFVHGPFAFDGVSINGHGLFGAFHNVSHLKYGTKDSAGGPMHKEEPDQYLPPGEGGKEDGKCDECKQIKQFN